MKDDSIERDVKLIERVKNDACDKSFLEICSLYEKVFYKICQGYSSALSKCGISVEDVLSEKNYIIWICCTRYDPKRNIKFSTLVGNYARYLCLKAITNKSLTVDFEDEEVKRLIEESQAKSSWNAKNTDDIIANLREKYDSLPDGKTKSVLSLRYLSEKKKTWKDISHELKISVPTVISLHNRGIDALKSKLCKK